MKRLKICSLLVIVLLLSSCYSVNIHQTAKTLGKSSSEMRISGSINGAPSNAKEEESSQNGGSISLPAFQYTLGILDRLDLGATLSLNRTGVYAKYQWLGNQDSKFAMASGAYIFGGLKYLDTNYNFIFFYPDLGLSAGYEIPLFISYHPTPNLSLYSNPLITYMNTVREEDELNVLREGQPFYMDGFYKGLATGIQWVAMPKSETNKQELTLSLEVGWGAPLMGNDYIFNVGGALIFKYSK